MVEADPQNRRRSQRVLLQVPVIIRTVTDDGKPVQSQAFTQVVNAHGGLFEASFRMTPGQKIRLGNPLARNDVGCRVVWVGAPRDGHSPTAFEFDEPNPHFWGIDFPPTNWSLVQQMADED